MRQAMPYRPQAVHKALDLPQGTFATYAREGLFDGFDGAATGNRGRGKPRMFSLRDVLALALFRALSRLLSHQRPDAMRICREFASRWVANQSDGMATFRISGGEDIRDLQITLDATEIFRRTAMAIEQAARPSAPHAFVVEGLAQTPATLAA